MTARRAGTGLVAVVMAGLLAATADAQPFNTETPVIPVTGDAAPLGDEDAAPAAGPSRASETAPPGMMSPPRGVTAKPAPGSEWAEHVSPSFRTWVEGDAPAPPRVARQPVASPTTNVQWAEHVSPSFRRWVDGDAGPAPAAVTAVPGDPAVRNRPGADQGASDLAGVENALDKAAPETPDKGGVGASTVFMKRVSRAHARAIAGPEGALMGAELADGISMAPLRRKAALPDIGAQPKLAAGPLPGDGPLQDIPPEPRYDGTPMYNPDAAPDEPGDDRAYMITMARGEVAGMELGDKVSVVHISQFAKGERPESGEFVVYPRGKFRPWGSINSFEDVNSFQAINVEPLQSAEDPSDPSPVARSAYAIGNWDIPDIINLPLSDNSLYERRAWLIAHLNDCCGRNSVTVMHDPLALVLHYNGMFFVPGQVATVIPLAPGLPAW